MGSGCSSSQARPKALGDGASLADSASLQRQQSRDSPLVAPSAPPAGSAGAGGAGGAGGGGGSGSGKRTSTLSWKKSSVRARAPPRPAVAARTKLPLPLLTLTSASPLLLSGPAGARRLRFRRADGAGHLAHHELDGPHADPPKTGDGA